MRHRTGAYLMNLGEMLETATDGYLDPRIVW